MLRGLSLLGAAAALLSACAAYGPSPQIPSALGSLAIVPSASLPKSNFATFAKGRPQGAVIGGLVGGGASAAAIIVVIAGTGGAAAPYVLLGAPFIVAADTAAGAVAGANFAVPADKASEIEAALRDSSAQLQSQRALAQRVAAAVADDGALSLGTMPHAQSVLELSVLSIELEGCKARHLFDPDACPGGTGNPALALSVRASASLARAEGGEPLFSREFHYRSPRRQLARWTAEGARLLDEELGRAYDDLASRIGEAILLAASIDLPLPSSLGRLPGIDPEYGLCGLAPRSPAARPYDIGELFAVPFTRRRESCDVSPLQDRVVDSTQPLLVWDAFPRQLDRERLDAAFLRRISGVSYELKVWSVEDCARSALVYSRSGLATPQHRPQVALQPGSRYFWSVRARFALDGQPMALPWSHFVPGTGCEEKEVPDERYHRFATPP
jgi:hypothetical protein